MEDRYYAVRATHLLHEHQAGKIVLTYCPTKLMVADALTKLATAEVVSVLLAAMDSRLPARTIASRAGDSTEKSHTRLGGACEPSWHPGSQAFASYCTGQANHGRLTLTESLFGKAGDTFVESVGEACSTWPWQHCPLLD